MLEEMPEGLLHLCLCLLAVALGLHLIWHPKEK